MKLALVVDVDRVVMQFAWLFVCATIWRPNPTERTLKREKNGHKCLCSDWIRTETSSIHGFAETLLGQHIIKQHFIKRSIVERVNISCEAREIFFLFSNWP